MWPFRKSQNSAPAPRKHTVDIRGGRQIDAQIRSASALRRRTDGDSEAVDHRPKRGMWVRWQGRTGILTDIEPGDIATVMLVDDERGENALEVHQPATELRQAYYEEIPAARRPAYDAAARMGYVSNWS